MSTDTNLVERLARIRIYAQDMLDNGWLSGGAIGNAMSIRDEVDALSPALASRIAELTLEKDEANKRASYTLAEYEKLVDDLNRAEAALSHKEGVEAVAWQRRLLPGPRVTNTDWHSVTKEQADFALEHGHPYGIPDVQCEVRPLYASPAPSVQPVVEGERWAAYWYGSPPGKGCTVWALTEHGTKARPVAYIGPDEAHLNLGREIADAHNAALAPAPVPADMEKAVEAACDAAYAVINKREGVIFTGLEKRPIPAEIKDWMRAALLAAAPFLASVREGWRPIETAPKDGTRFLAAQPDSGGWIVGVCLWCKTPHVPIYGFHFTEGDPEDWDIAKPTIWQPLPPLPAAPQDGGRADG
jgi:hypothetical protein